MTLFFLLDGHASSLNRSSNTSLFLHRRTGPGFQGSQDLGVAPADQNVVILHAKVAQKSYGNEKRFFCPPPCVYISGPGWRITQDHMKGYADSVHGYMCLDISSQSQADTFKLVFDEQPDSRRMFACAKSLFISDQDKRKHFCLLLRLFLGSRQEVGSFQSRMIKVISKPSQKRQSLKNADLCISSGSRVALFHRLRSQTVSTRYLSVDRGAFIASARRWTAFTITTVGDQGGVVMSEGFICYGLLVQLICTESGVALPPMVGTSRSHARACVSPQDFFAEILWFQKLSTQQPN
uniref:Recombination signal binding protein for immunoglobulin kappa J region-like n=1 Tax=Oryzias sinensis TaxID=183150 RepID=A0A8C7WSN0_9TELE